MTKKLLPLLLLLGGLYGAENSAQSQTRFDRLRPKRVSLRLPNVPAGTKSA